MPLRLENYLFASSTFLVYFLNLNLNREATWRASRGQSEFFYSSSLWTPLIQKVAYTQFLKSCCKFLNWAEF